jgi:hypothetical protein
MLEGFGVRAQTSGRRTDKGWRQKPLTREEAWETVKGYLAEGFTFVEVVNFKLDKVVYTAHI